MITVIKPDTNTEKQAVEAMEICAKMYKVKFTCCFATSKNVVFSTNRWAISVMEKRFINSEFIFAVREAVEFVYKAHENQDK
jgi:hypothetical protein